MKVNLREIVFDFLLFAVFKKMYSSIHILLILLSISGISQSYSFERGCGLKPFSKEDIDYIEQKLPWITTVTPNKIGRARIYENLRNNGKYPIELSFAISPKEEIKTTIGLPQEIIGKKNLRELPLPRHVDNSTRPSFPPIGDQGQQGSCVAWGSTYYQATHEIGLLNGYNNKVSNKTILSPKWTYNLINSGVDEGGNPFDAYALLSNNGVVSIANFPYDKNFLEWDLNAQDWISAISFRTKSAQMIAGLGGNKPQNLKVLKQILNNGHILTFATFINSWVFTKVEKDPHAPSPYAGQLAASWMNGADGGHFMTIVGYDDDVWIDINGNNHVDHGEKGAFLIANSWGPAWGNHGFIWVAYDSFLAHSAVSHGPKGGRVPLADAMNSYAISIFPKSANYSPKLISQFTLNQANRNQVSIHVGSSDLSSTSPAKIFNSGALINQGGTFQFDGTKGGAPKSATFAVDLTDLLPTTTLNNRYYLCLSDNNSKNPTILSSYTVMDRVHNNQVSLLQVPLSCDNDTINPYVEYNFQIASAIETTPPSISITSPLNGATIKKKVEVIVNATDSSHGIDRVELYVDSLLYETDATVPYLFSVDTAKLSDGTHNFMAIAYNSTNETAENNIDVIVQND